MRQILLLTIVVFGYSSFKAQGPFPPAAGQINSTAIHKDSTIFSSWGQMATADIGYMNINAPESGLANFGSIEDTYGTPNNEVFSLGDLGSITFHFDFPIINGPGADFAVFENAFDDNFLELAFVDVSSDGFNFYRFPSISLTSDSVQTDAFGQTDPTMIHNLAGKYRLDYGTPFDLSDLAGLNALDINNIIAIKVTDVIGNIGDTNNSFDSEGHVINDPFPTEFASSGFDLDAIGIIHSVTNVVDIDTPKFHLYPNPVSEEFRLVIEAGKSIQMEVLNAWGESLFHEEIFGGENEFNSTSWKPGVYWIRLTKDGKTSTKRLVKI